MALANDLASSYYNWIRESLSFSTIENGTVRIDTPFFDRHNDSLIMYALPDGNNLVLTDGGYTIDDLESDGISITKSKSRKKFLEDQLISYGVNLDYNDNFLSIKTNLEKFPADKHRLLQAMLFANDLFLTSNSRSKNIFFEEVQHYFEENDIRALENASYTGSNGLTHKFEYSIPGSKKRNISDKLIKVLSSPKNEMYAKVLATDVRYTRNIVNRETEFYTIINDTEKSIADSIISLMDEEEIKTIPFSQRDSFIEELTA